MSTAGRLVSGRDSAPNNASAPRTARGIPSSDTAPRTHAIAGSRLGLPPRPTPGAHIPAPRTPQAPVRNVAEKCLHGAAPSLPKAAGLEASALPHLRDA